MRSVIPLLRLEETGLQTSAILFHMTGQDMVPQPAHLKQPLLKRLMDNVVVLLLTVPIAMVHGVAPASANVDSNARHITHRMLSVITFQTSQRAAAILLVLELRLCMVAVVVAPMLVEVPLLGLPQLFVKLAPPALLTKVVGMLNVRRWPNVPNVMQLQSQLQLQRPFQTPMLLQSPLHRFSIKPDTRTPNQRRGQDLPKKPFP
jgi:hypothetical protein